MIELKRCDSENQDFQFLVKQLDEYLTEKDGDEHSFYDQFNKIDHIKYVVVAYIDHIPVGCGAIKHYENKIMEVKRMFVPPLHRGKGIASKVLKELENWTVELGHTRCILETGKRQVEAVALYLKNNYKIIPNYGQYASIENSVCFEKELMVD